MVKSRKSLTQWLNKLETSHNKKIDLGLKRVRTVYENLKLEKIAPHIITVAGTNGKGSTVAILTSICHQAGLKVGAFTSPHIINFNERITINQKQVFDNEIINAFEKIDDNLNGITLSYFEYATLAALILFKENNVDVAILEVGLGGRLDSVNVVDTDCAIITTIDIDHTDWLGDDIESIAFEKAGIMRTGKPVIYGDENCPKSIINHARKIKAKLIFSDPEITIKSTNLKGDYQKKNIRAAITALRTLPLSISDENITKALKNIKLKGRLQTISTEPEVIIDVSHNEQAAKELAQWLQNNPISGKTLSVFSVLKDKNANNWIALFDGLIDAWCISKLNSHRAMETQEILMNLADSSKLITSYDSINQAFQGAKTMAHDKDRILVFGSFYTVSEVLES